MKRSSAILYGGFLALGAMISGGVLAEEAAPAPAGSLSSVSGPAAALTPRAGSHSVHILPTIPYRKQLQLGKSSTLGSGNLTYHAGGPIMNLPTFYIIYWVPPKLQNGATSAGLSAAYQVKTRQMISLYGQHSLNTINTQYYQTIAGKTTYISGAGAYRGVYVDKNPFPARGCNDAATPGNCLTDAQIQAEITRVKNLMGWQSGINNMYILFTPPSMGSCFDSSSSSCAYTQYCAYHGAYGSTASPTVYSNEPYGDASVCWDGGPSPSNDVPLDAALSAASHEISEAITDPELNAWFDAAGYENGDKCAYTFGTATWDASKANQMWSGAFFRLQEEWSNHTANCLQAGP